MADQSQPPVNQRFKAEMPQIPGVSASGTPNRPGGSGKWLVSGGLLAVLVAVALGGKLIFRPRHADPPVLAAPQADSAANRELPVPPAIDSDAPIAQVGDLAKPWDARQFTFRNKITGENVQALLLRLPTGSAGQASGYWALAMHPAYGNCRLDYLQDVDKLRADYSYAQAHHPAVTNPCTHTVYDPTRYASLPGGVLVRGAIVQGTDLRPPLGIEIKIRGKDILATRME